MRRLGMVRRDARKNLLQRLKPLPRERRFGRAEARPSETATAIAAQALPQWACYGVSSLAGLVGMRLAGDWLRTRSDGTSWGNNPTDLCFSGTGKGWIFLMSRT